MNKALSAANSSILAFNYPTIMQNLNYNAFSLSNMNHHMQKSSLIRPTSSDEHYSDTIVWQKDLDNLLSLSIEIWDSLIKICFRQFKRDTYNNIKITAY